MIVDMIDMTRMNLSVIVLASAALLVAGCGSSSSPGVARLSSNTSGGSAADGAGKASTPERGASAQQKMVAYSQCMRTHGVPEFPEPTEGHLLIHSSSHNGHVTGVNPRSSQFQAAQKVCGKLIPERRGPQPGATGQGAGKRPEVLSVHAHPRGPQLPRSDLLRRRSEVDAEGRRRERDRSQLAAVQGRTENVSIVDAKTAGRAGWRRTLYKQQRWAWRFRRRIRGGRGPVSGGAFGASAIPSRNRRCPTSIIGERSRVR